LSELRVAKSSSFVGAAMLGRRGALVKTLKTNGLADLDRLIARTRRQLALDRIDEQDATYIVTRLQDVEQRIIEMDELNEDGEPEEILSGTEDSNTASG
jgi:hypothetical protein